jgi:hypothetical protein
MFGATGISLFARTAALSGLSVSSKPQMKSKVTDTLIERVLVI